VDGSTVGLGAQDVSDQDSGAYTGEVSGEMLKDVGCRYVIVGHSERRSLYAEDDAFTARKFAAARRHGLKPILCVGELLEERESGVTEQVVARQLDAVMDLEGVESLKDAVVAYEPVWAIGTGKTATPDRPRQCTPSSVPGWPSAMPALPRGCASSTAEASRRTMRRNCSRSPISTEA
jgi:triosephosphate isomerase (TIM)